MNGGMRVVNFDGGEDGKSVKPREPRKLKALSGNRYGHTTRTRSRYSYDQLAIGIKLGLQRNLTRFSERVTTNTQQSVLWKDRNEFQGGDSLSP